MKNLFYIILFFIISYNSLYSQWFYVEPKLPNIILKNIKFFSPEVAIIVGTKGTILRTTNSGLNWNIIPSDTSQTYTDISIINDKAFVVGDSGVMICSTDFGESWKEINNNITSDLHSIYFIDSLIGWCAGKNVIYKTINGGLNWNLQYTATPQWFYYIRFINLNIGLAVGESNIGAIIYKTTNGGESWVFNHLMRESAHSSIQFINDSIIYVLGESSIFLKTMNQGLTWDTLYVVENGLHDVFAICFLNESKGWITDHFGAILYTSDGGVNWIMQRPRLGGYDFLESIVMFDSTTGWAVGTGFDNNTSEHFGAILKTTNGGITFVANDIEVNNYFLKQNYPNPFNPSTKIKYTLPKQGLVIIKVFDVLGKEIAQLVNEEKPSGEYEVEFDGSSLSSGIYFYQIQSAEFLDTKKMVMMK